MAEGVVDYRSLRTKLIGIVLFGAILPLTLTGWWLARSAVRTSETDLMNRLEAAVMHTHRDLTAAWQRHRTELLDLGEAGLADTDEAGPESAEGTETAVPAGAVPESARAAGRLSKGGANPVDAAIGWARRAEIRNANGVLIAEYVPPAARAFDAPIAVPVTLPIRDAVSGDLRGSIDAEIPIASLLDPTRSIATTPGAVLGLFDAGSGASYLPLPFGEMHLGEEVFESAGITWRTSSRSVPQLGLTIVGAIPLSSLLAPLEEAATDGLRVLLIVTIGILVLVSIQVRPILGSLRDLTRAAEAVSRGDLDIAVPTGGSAELARLGAAFNHMTATLRTTLTRLSEREGLAAVGEFAASLSHDVRNALTSVRVDLDLLGERLPDDPDLRRIQSRASRRSAHLNDIVTAALDLARSGRVNLEPVDIAQPIARTIDSVAVVAESRRVRLTTADAETRGHLVNGDVNALERIFTNVLINAVEASPPDSSVTLDVVRDNGWIEVRIRDRGPGIPEALTGRLFQPMASAKPGGTGMGLAIARRIARSHGGDVDVESTGPDGTGIRIRLPQLAEAP